MIMHSFGQYQIDNL
jgi:hypothetical protein